MGGLAPVRQRRLAGLDAGLKAFAMAIRIAIPKTHTKNTHLGEAREAERDATGARRKAQNDKNPREKSGAPCAVVGSSVEVRKKFKRAPAARAGVRSLYILTRIRL